MFGVGDVDPVEMKSSRISHALNPASSLARPRGMTRDPPAPRAGLEMRYATRRHYLAPSHALSIYAPALILRPTPPPPSLRADTLRRPRYGTHLPTGSPTLLSPNEDANMLPLSQLFSLLPYAGASSPTPSNAALHPAKPIATPKPANSKRLEAGLASGRGGSINVSFLHRIPIAPAVFPERPPLYTRAVGSFATGEPFRFVQSTFRLGFKGERRGGGVGGAVQVSIMDETRAAAGMRTRTRIHRRAEAPSIPSSRVRRKTDEEPDPQTSPPYVELRLYKQAHPTYTAHPTCRMLHFVRV
ncbi:hypothetical protein DFH07DRAFT_1058114 [Mycena maculata]|uniref:Uncharacterized protein n=1 Tax=Mycena maculata TaxID=230809 RepID=A0AAD7JQ54_9AGAR|nr:hypothetical protein DFH07DRAFT_1058114 [Mycena maculata]